MNDKEKLRRLNHLMGNNYLNPEYFESWKQRTLEEGKKGVFKFQYEKHNSHMEIYEFHDFLYYLINSEIFIIFMILLILV